MSRVRLSARVFVVLTLATLPVYPQATPRNDKLRASIEAEYSDEARLAELEGSVVVSGVAGEDGHAKDLRVVQSLGLGLDEQAIEAIRQWQFKPDPVPTNITVDFALPSKQSRWHLIGVNFHPPEGASRPSISRVDYPPGPGVFTGPAIEEGRLLGALGRQAFAVVSFDVDETGVPVHIQVRRSSYEVWDADAMAVLSNWRFAPGMKDGKAVSVPCTFDFVWGPRNLASSDVALLRDALHPPPVPPTASGNVPEIVYKLDPPYPEQARNAGVEGTVMVSLSVGGDGAPRDLRVVQGIDPAIDRSVADTLGEWRFRPVILNGTTLNGAAAIVPLVIRVSFQLPDQVTSVVTRPSIPVSAKR